CRVDEALVLCLELVPRALGVRRECGDQSSSATYRGTPRPANRQASHGTSDDVGETAQGALSAIRVRVHLAEVVRNDPDASRQCPYAHKGEVAKACLRKLRRGSRRQGGSLVRDHRRREANPHSSQHVNRDGGQYLCELVERLQ